MEEQAPKLFNIKTLSPPSIQLTLFWPNNIETWFCHAEVDFDEHFMTDLRAPFLAAVEALTRDFNRYGTSNMSNNDVPDPYEYLKGAILKRGDLTDRQI